MAAYRRAVVVAIEAILAETHLPGTKTEIVETGGFLAAHPDARGPWDIRPLCPRRGRGRLREFTDGSADSGFTAAVGAPTGWHTCRSQPKIHRMVERQNRPFRKRRHANGHWVVEPLPDAEELARLYDESYYTPESAAAEYLPTYGDEELRHKRLMAECSLELASRDLKICSDQLRLLDVGCGEGFVMAAAAARGWSVAGIDFTTAGVARHHPELLAHVSVGDWQTLLASLPPASVDLCCLANVVEHVREPDALLRRTASLLAPDGRLVVAVPNDDNLLQRLARECRHIHSDPWFCPPEHLSYFNTATFASFAKVAGLQILDMITTFPIEAFLFSPGSNYVETPSLGKHVHRGRIQIESALMGRDMHGYQAMGRAQARLGIGRNIIAVLQPA